MCASRTRCTVLTNRISAALVRRRTALPKFRYDAMLRSAGNDGVSLIWSDRHCFCPEITNDASAQIDNREESRHAWQRVRVPAAPAASFFTELRSLSRRSDDHCRSHCEYHECHRDPDQPRPGTLNKQAGKRSNQQRCGNQLRDQAISLRCDHRGVRRIG